MSTICPHPKCDKRLKKREIACRHHWLQLPTKVQIEVVEAQRDPTPGANSRWVRAVDAMKRCWANDLQIERVRS